MSLVEVKQVTKINTLTYCEAYIFKKKIGIGLSPQQKSTGKFFWFEP